MIKYVADNKAPYERILAGLPKGLKSCGTKKVKNSDGTEKDPADFNVLEMMARVEIKA